MGKIDSWITKIPRLKNSKVARFSYKAEAYANDDIEGVDSYDYSNGMNVPLATHTDFDGSVLSTGARANFSSIPKNGLNHFFGRVSYNLNKVIDFLSDFLDDFIALNDSFISFTEIVSFSSSATLSNYANGTTKRLLNTAGSTITITLPVGETYLGSNTILLTPSIMLTITKRGAVWVNSSGNAITALTADKWKTARNVTISDADGTNTGTAVSVDGSENETLKLPSTIKATLSGNATTATLATQANAIKPLGNSIAFAAASTSTTKIIKIASVGYTWSGTIKIGVSGGGVADNVSLQFGQRADINGVQVTYSKYQPLYGINKIIVTRDGADGGATRNIYIEFKNYPNYSQTITLGVVVTEIGSFSTSMVEVSSVAGTVVDSLELSYLRGDISSYQHEFTKNIIGNLTGDVTGNASTATTASKTDVRVSLRHGTTFFEKTWNGFTNVEGKCIWTDGDNIYRSYVTDHYVLNKSTSTWSSKTWNGLPSFDGRYIWTDGDNIYYSSSNIQYILNKSTSTWSSKTWNGLPSFDGLDVWTDGDNIYYSSNNIQYILNKSTSTWSSKTWNGFTNFIGRHVWTDGDNIYYSLGQGTQYVLNKSTSTWSSKTWTGLTDFTGRHVWTDGDNIYYSSSNIQYILNKSTSTWSSKTWNGLPSFDGLDVWTDGDNIYYSSSNIHYILPATRHNYVDDTKYNSLFGIVTKCDCSTLSDRFVFRNE